MRDVAGGGPPSARLEPQGGNHQISPAGEASLAASSIHAGTAFAIQTVVVVLVVVVVIVVVVVVVVIVVV